MPDQLKDRIEPKKELRHMPPRQVPTKQVVVYICPTEGCPDYYGAPEFMPQYGINEMQYHRSQSDGQRVASHPRTECPRCRVNGIHVQRVPYIVAEMVPFNEMVKVVENAA